MRYPSTTLGAWICFLCVLLYCATALQPSPDLWWQLAGGRIMILQSTFPRFDTFSFTANGLPWLNHEWMAECWMYWIYRLGGTAGLHVVKILLLFLTFWIVSRVAVRAGADETLAALACAIAVLNAQWRYFFDVRPYLFTYLGIAATYYFAAMWLRGGQRIWLGILPPLFVLWANLHSAVIVGVLMLFGYGLGALRSSRYRAVALIEVAIVCTIACVLNPFGVQILTFPFRFISHSTVWAAGLNEWARPALLGKQWPSLLYMFFVWTCVGLALRRVGFQDLLMLFAFSILASTAWRHMTLFAIASVPAVALGLQSAWDRIVRGRVVPLRWKAGFGVLATTAGLVGAACRLDRVDFSSLGLERRMFPMAAVAFLRANPLPTDLFNPYGWGGYFDWNLSPRYRVFMDGRANTLFPEDVYDDFLRASQGQAGWEKMMARRGVHAIVISKIELANAPRSLGSELPDRKDWLCVYEDDLSRIYVHDDVTTREALKAWRSGRWRYPAAAQVEAARRQIDVGRYDVAERMLSRLLRSHEGEASAHLLLGIVALRRGEPVEAEAQTREAIALDPTLLEAHYNLAVLLNARGDREEAMKALQEELDIDPDWAPAVGFLRSLRARTP